MKIYMIRHGETNWNKERRLQGKADIPLNEFGRHLARETAPAFNDISFDCAYTSPLIRAKETAELVLNGRNIPIVDEPRIMEMGFGEYEGLCCSREAWNIPDPDFNNFFEAPHKYKAPKGGETFEQITQRLQEFLTQLYNQQELQDKTILLSTHGAALCGILRLIKQNPIEKYWDGGVHKNCAVTIVEVEKAKPTILEEAIVYYKDNVSDW